MYRLPLPLLIAALPTTFLGGDAAMCNEAPSSTSHIDYQIKDRDSLIASLPMRIETSLPPTDSIPVPPSTPVPFGCRFLGSNLKIDPQDTSASISIGDHYSTSYPRMELYTLFPVLGKLYCFDRTVNERGEGRLSASQLRDSEIPPGVKLGRYSHIFASFPYEEPRGTGMLDDHYLGVGPISTVKHGEDVTHVVRLRVAPRARAFFPLLDQKVRIEWQSKRVGDVVDILDDTTGMMPKRDPKPKHYRIVNIVPPDAKGHMIRGHLCKMIGWIELDLKPVTIDAKAGR